MSTTITNIGRCKQEMTPEGWAMFCEHRKADPDGAFDPESRNDSEEILLSNFEMQTYEYGQGSAQRQYVAKGGGVCPACGSQQIEGGAIDVDGASASQSIVCNNCGADWMDLYQLVGYADLNNTKH